MLDALEAGIAALRPNPVSNWGHWVSGPTTMPLATTPDMLRRELEAGNLTPPEASAVLEYPLESVHDWLTGGTPAPRLALTALRLYRRLTAAERRKVLKSALPMNSLLEPLLEPLDDELFPVPPAAVPEPEIVPSPEPLAEPKPVGIEPIPLPEPAPSAAILQQHVRQQHLQQRHLPQHHGHPFSNIEDL